MTDYAPSAEALQQQLREQEEAVLADLREHGELVRLDLSEYHADGTFAWTAGNRGDGKGWGRHHSYETIDRLMHRGEVVLLGDDGKGNHTRCRLTPTCKSCKHFGRIPRCNSLAYCCHPQKPPDDLGHAYPLTRAELSCELHEAH